MKYIKKPVVLDATQWFKNGDHPNDFDADKQGFENGEFRTWTAAEVKANGWEGQVVRYYRRPSGDGQVVCAKCNQIMHVHGWIDSEYSGFVVCPGDWIITGESGEYYPCKPNTFTENYELF